jgi:hypothetical protein
MYNRANITTIKPEKKRENPVSMTQKTDLSQSQSIRSPIDHILFLQKTIGNHAVQGLFKFGIIQTKLKIGQPNDIYELEADRVAEQVMNMSEPSYPERDEEEGKEHIQAKPVGEQITPLVQRQVEDEEEVEEEETIQTKGGMSQTPDVPSDLEPNIQSLKGGGQPLPKSVRNFFEPRFEHDFSKIRVHNDAKSADIARSLNARAFTVGRDVLFGPGQYTPATLAGKRLLAHELTHVVQQQSSTHLASLSKSDNVYVAE